MKGIFSTLTFAALLLLGSVACAGPSLDDEDLRIAEEQLARLQSRPGDRIFVSFAHALAEVPMGRSDQCLEDAQAAFSVQPHHWQMHVARTIESCGMSCPTKEPLSSVAQRNPPLSTQTRSEPHGGSVPV